MMDEKRINEKLDFTPDASPADFAPGQIIAGRYLVQSVIGQGGMGIVYKVEQIYLKQQMALKTLDPKKVNAVTWQRLQKEAKAASILDHPNLVKVFDFGLLPDERPFFAMQYVAGRSVADYLHAHGPMSPQQALPIYIQVAFALDYAHSQGIVHRDIKPSNILLEEQKELLCDRVTAKVVDFGIAKFVDGGQALTQTGEIFGTPYYMSPEQCMGTTIDARSDQYSLACAIFETLTGTPPFVSVSPLTIMMQQKEDAAPKLSAVAPTRTFPDQLEAALAKALEKEPDKRYKNLEAFARDLIKSEQSLKEGVTPIAPPKSQAPSPSISQIAARSKGLGWLAILAIGFGFGLGVPMVLQSNQNNDDQSEPKQTVTQEPVSASLSSDESAPKGVASDGTEKSTFQTFSKLETLPSGKQKRVYLFPNDISYGEIGYDREHHWKAQGCVTLDAGRAIWFEPSYNMAKKPHLFSQFRPNELTALICRSNEQIDDNATIFIKDLTSLTELNLSGTEVTDKALSNIDNLKSLRHLNIAKTYLDGKEVAKLSFLPNLIILHADEIRNGSDVVRRLVESKSIKEVSLGGTELTDADLEELAKIKSLVSLKASGNHFSAQKLPLLLGMTNLRSLMIRRYDVEPLIATAHNTNLSELVISPQPAAKLARLRAALPPTCKLKVVEDNI